MEKKTFLQKLMHKWKLKNIFQLILVMLVFSLTGTTILVLRKTLFDWLGFTEATPIFVKIVVYIVFIFPAYQILILLYGFLFGQFDFFWEKEKRLLQKLKILGNKK